jgi:hypothetical protein
MNNEYKKFLIRLIYTNQLLDKSNEQLEAFVYQEFKRLFKDAEMEVIKATVDVMNKVIHIVICIEHKNYGYIRNITLEEDEDRSNENDKAKVLMDYNANDKSRWGNEKSAAWKDCVKALSDIDRGVQRVEMVIGMCGNYVGFDEMGFYPMYDITNDIQLEDETLEELEALIDSNEDYWDYTYTDGVIFDNRYYLNWC